MSWFWECGHFLPFIIKRIMGIKCIFSCSFGNKHTCMCLLTRAYGILPTGTITGAVGGSILGSTLLILIIIVIVVRKKKKVLIVA